MLQKILKFIKYNNTAAFIFTIIFSGASASLAASPTVRDSLYASSQTVSSIDNTAILYADIKNFDFNLKIVGVTEDQDSYYATYSYTTYAIEDGVWKKLTKQKTLEVEKLALEEKDFGLFLAQELSENINGEREYLLRVQESEKEKGKSNKVVTVEYRGLVGKFLDPDEKVIEGYRPVIPEIIPEEEEAVVPSEEPILTPEEKQKLSEDEIRNIINNYLKEHDIKPVKEEELKPVVEEEPAPIEDEAPVDETPIPDPTEETPPVDETPDPTVDPTPDPTPTPVPPIETPPSSTPPPETTPTPTPPAPEQPTPAPAPVSDPAPAAP